MGRPVQAYDDNGNIVWQADYDIYGNSVTFTAAGCSFLSAS
ncbi:RHS domain-containing protein [Prevotella jejuni]|nr:RHS domain-containing protein [Prevotella jejuni]